VPTAVGGLKKRLKAQQGRDPYRVGEKPPVLTGGLLFYSYNR